jgi:hypothetical protein
MQLQAMMILERLEGFPNTLVISANHYAQQNEYCYE